MHSSSELSCNMFSAFYIWGSQDRRTGSCLRRKSDRRGIWGFLVYVTPGCVALKLKPVVIQGDACSHDWWVLLKKRVHGRFFAGDLCLEGNLYVNVQNKATTKKSVGKKNRKVPWWVEAAGKNGQKNSFPDVHCSEHKPSPCSLYVSFQGNMSLLFRILS